MNKQEKFETLVENSTNGNYIVLGVYKGSSKLIKIKHMECGHVFMATPRDFRVGKRCPLCNNKKFRKVKIFSDPEKLMNELFESF